MLDNLVTGSLALIAIVASFQTLRVWSHPRQTGFRKTYLRLRSLGVTLAVLKPLLIPSLRTLATLTMAIVTMFLYFLIYTLYFWVLQFNRPVWLWRFTFPILGICSILYLFLWNSTTDSIYGQMQVLLRSLPPLFAVSILFVVVFILFSLRQRRTTMKAV